MICRAGSPGAPVSDGPAELGVGTTETVVQSQEPQDAKLEAFESAYTVVKADPSDFNKWVGLISATEKLVSLSYSVACRAAGSFANFLAPITDMQDLQLIAGYY